MNDAIPRTAAGAVAHPTIERLDSASEHFDVPWKGRQVRWRRFGHGTPLVLIHGGHGCWLQWVANIDALAMTHSVWVPDLPGFGDSDSLPGAVHASDRFERLVEATQGTLATLVADDTSIDIAAFSFGSIVAAELARRRGNVRRLVFIGPVGHGGRRRPHEDLLDWRLEDRDAMVGALQHNLAVFMLRCRPLPESLAIAVHETACRGARFRSKQISRSDALKQAIAGLSQPILFVWGEQDVTCEPEEIAMEIADLDRGREWCVIPGAGHWVQFERASEVNRILAIWFAPAGDA